MFIIPYVNNNLEFMSQVPMDIYETAKFQLGIDKQPMGSHEF